MATLRVITSLESITVSQVSKVFLVKFLVMRIRMVRIAKSNVTARKMPNVIMKLVSNWSGGNVSNLKNEPFAKLPDFLLR